MRTPNDTNFRFIELKSGPFGYTNPYKKLDIKNSQYKVFLAFTLKVSITERLLYMYLLNCKDDFWTNLYISVLIYCQLLCLNFGPRVYPRGSLVIAVVRGLLVRPPLNISETFHCFFLIFCMMLEHHKGAKVTEPDFWKKIFWGHKWGKTPIFGVFLMFFVHISSSSH